MTFKIFKKSVLPSFHIDGVQAFVFLPDHMKGVVDIVAFETYEANREKADTYISASAPELVQ